MAITFNTTYPPALTEAAWQKQKSFKDKLKAKTKTGLGAALKTAETAWGKVNFAALDAKNQPLTRTPIDVARNKVAAEKILGQQVKTASRALELAASKARTTSENPALSPKAAQAAKRLSAQLLKLAVNLKSLNLDDFDADAQQLRDGFQKDVDRAVKIIAQLDVAFDRLYKTPTSAKFTELKFGPKVTEAYGVFTVGFRSMEDPRFVALNDEWKALADLLDRTKRLVEDDKVPAGAAEQQKYFRDLVAKGKPLTTRLKTLK